MIVNFFDNNIRHAGSYDEALEPGRKNLNIVYEYFQTQKSNITLFTDSYLSEAKNVDTDFKVAWIMEPRALCPGIYEYLEKNIDLFDRILTFDHDLLVNYPQKCQWIPADGIFLDSDSIFNSVKKDRFCSHLYSAKTILEGHKFRHTLALEIKNKDLKVDMFGTGPNTYLAKKSESLNRYRFSFAIENNIKNTYFTEKILDCFATKTIPIYRGAPNIGDWFDIRGIFPFETIGEAVEIVENADTDLYEKMKPFVEENYKKSLQFYSVDQFIYEELRRL